MEMNCFIIFIHCCIMFENFVFKNYSYKLLNNHIILLLPVLITKSDNNKCHEHKNCNLLLLDFRVVIFIDFQQIYLSYYHVLM